MARDGRGNPGRIILKNQPALRLVDVLRRRRSTLRKLLDDLGVSTYSGLVNWCSRMGIAPVTPAEFEVVIPSTLKVNNPQEGVIVLEAPVVIAEQTGNVIQVGDPMIDAEIFAALDAGDEPTEGGQKKRRSKKDSQTNDV